MVMYLCVNAQMIILSIVRLSLNLLRFDTTTFNYRDKIGSYTWTSVVCYHRVPKIDWLDEVGRIWYNGYDEYKLPTSALICIFISNYLDRHPKSSLCKRVG